MKRSNWAGLIATGLLSVTALSGCGGDPPTPANPGGSTGTGGTTSGGTATGGTTSGGAAVGMALPSPDWFVKIGAADATAGPTPAPAKYGALICTSCHGNLGEGNPPFGPEIRHVDPTYGAWVVRNGRPASSMVAFKPTDITDAEITEIMTWLNSLPKPTAGETLYKDFCGNCHGPTMPTGGAIPVAIRGLPMAGVNVYVRNGGSTPDPAMRNNYMPKFDPTLLTDAELAQIHTFLGSTP